MTSLIFQKYKQSQKTNVNSKNVNSVNNTLTNTKVGLKNQPSVSPNVLLNTNVNVPQVQSSQTQSINGSNSVAPVTNLNVQSSQTQNVNGNDTNVIQPVVQSTTIVPGYSLFSAPPVKNDKPCSVKQQQKRRSMTKRIPIPRGWFDFYSMLISFCSHSCSEWWIGVTGLTGQEANHIKTFIAVNNLVVDEVANEHSNRCALLFYDWTLEFVACLRLGTMPEYMQYFPLVDNYRTLNDEGKIEFGQNPICDDKGEMTPRARAALSDLRNHYYYTSMSTQTDKKYDDEWDDRRTKLFGGQNMVRTVTKFLDLMLDEKTVVNPVTYDLSKIDFKGTANNTMNTNGRSGTTLPSNVPGAQAKMPIIQVNNDSGPKLLPVQQNQPQVSTQQIAVKNDVPQQYPSQINATQPQVKNDAPQQQVNVQTATKKSNDSDSDDYVNFPVQGSLKKKKKIQNDESDDDDVDFLGNVRKQMKNTKRQSNVDQKKQDIKSDISNYDLSEEPKQATKGGIFNRIKNNMKQKEEEKRVEQKTITDSIYWNKEKPNFILPHKESYEDLQDTISRLEHQNTELQKQVRLLNPGLLENLFKLCTTEKLVELDFDENVFCSIGRSFRGKILATRITTGNADSFSDRKQSKNKGDGSKKNNNKNNNTTSSSNNNSNSKNNDDKGKGKETSNTTSISSKPVTNIQNVLPKPLAPVEVKNKTVKGDNTVPNAINTLIKAGGVVINRAQGGWANLMEELDLSDTDVSEDPNNTHNFGGEKRESYFEPLKGTDVVDVDYIEGYEFPHGVSKRVYGRNVISGTSYDDEINALPEFIWQADGIKYLTKENPGDLVQGDLVIVPKTDNEGKGPFGELKGYLSSKFEYISIKGVPKGIRVSLNNGTKMMIPQSMLGSSATHIRKEVKNIVTELKEKIKDKVICHSLLSTLTNNMWRKNVTLEFLKYQDDYINKKPVFGKILESLGDGCVFNINGHKYIETLPVGGFTQIGEDVILGPFKNGCGNYSKSVIWDVDGREVTLDNMLEMRKELEDKFPKAIIQFHAYQSHNTLHCHKFNSLDDYAFFTLCDLWTDRHYSYLRKGFFVDMMEPLNVGTLDLQILSYLFYCLGIRLGDRIYNLGLESFEKAYDAIQKDVFTSEFFKKVKEKLLSEKKLYYCTSDHRAFANNISKAVYEQVTKNGPNANIWYGGGMDLSTLMFGRKEIYVYPSKYALEHDPNPMEDPVYQTHPSLFVEVSDNYKVADRLTCFRTNGCRAYKSLPKRGNAKMTEMMTGIEFKSNDKVLIVGDGQGGFADAISKVVKRDNIDIIDIAARKDVCERYNVKVTNFLTMDFAEITKYNFIVSDVCASKGPDSMKKFLNAYKNVYLSANMGTRMLLKIKGLYEGESLSEIGNWVNLMSDKCPTMKIVKPASSRLRNSECYIYFTKSEIPINTGKNLVGMYITALKSNVKHLSRIDMIYDMQSLVTPMAPMILTDFVKTLPNGSNVELVAPDMAIFPYFSFAFQFSKLFKSGDRYCFQGKKYELCSMFSVMGGKYLMGDRLTLENGVADYIAGQKRRLYNKPTCIFNCVKHMLPSLNITGSVIDIGCGKSGFQYIDNKMVSYPAMFSDYVGIDPQHPDQRGRMTLDQWLEAQKVTKVHYDNALMIQSSHYCIDDKGEKIKEMLKYVDSIWYTTWRKSNKQLVGKNGKIFYKNNGTNVTWAGLEQKITPVFGDVYCISDLGFSTYNRIKTDYYKEILDDVLLVNVTANNFKQVNVTGGCYSKSVNVYHDKVITPYVDTNNSTKKEKTNVGVFGRVRNAFLSFK